MNIDRSSLKEKHSHNISVMGVLALRDYRRGGVANINILFIMETKNIEVTDNKRESYREAILELYKEFKDREKKLYEFKACPLRDWLEVNAFKIYNTMEDLDCCLDYLNSNYERYSSDEEMGDLWRFANTTLYYKWLYEKYGKIYFGHLV